MVKRETYPTTKNGKKKNFYFVRYNETKLARFIYRCYRVTYTHCGEEIRIRWMRADGNRAKFVDLNLIFTVRLAIYYEFDETMKN